MSSSGKPQRRDGSIAFRVDHRVLPAGARLRRYFMHQYAQVIDPMHLLIEAGPASLAQHLTASDWQQMHLGDKTVRLESEVLKMMLVLEAIFEHARTRVAPQLPSRLECVFVWPTLELAERFRDLYSPEGTIHRCCIVQGEVVERDGGLLPPGIDLSDLSPEVFSAEFHATLARAEKYWLAQEFATQAKLLVAGQVEVVRVETGHQ